MITYINEAGTAVTLTATKAENGSWTLDNTPTDVSIDAITGVVTLQPDAVTDFTQVDSTGTDQYDNTADATVYSGYDDTTAEAADAPVLTANDDGSVTAQPGADNIQQVITYINEAGTAVTLTATKAENGSWTLLDAENQSVNSLIATINVGTGIVTLQPNAVKDSTQVDSTGTDQYGKTADAAPVISVPDNVAAAIDITSISEDTGASTIDFITSDTTLTVNGILVGNLGSEEKAQISLDNVNWIDLTVFGGMWSYFDNRDLTNGESYTYHVRIQDSSGGTISSVSKTVIIDSINAQDDTIDLELGSQIAEIWDEPINEEDVDVIDSNLLINSDTAGVDFTVPKSSLNGDQNRTGDVVITVTQENLLAVASGYRVTVVRLNADGSVTEVKVATTENGLLLGSEILQLLDVSSDVNTIGLMVNDLPEGNYRIIVENDESELSSLLTNLTLANLGSGEQLLGAENQQLILDALQNAVGGTVLTDAVLDVVTSLLNTVNVLRLDILLDALEPVLVDTGLLPTLDGVVDSIVARLVNNTLSVLANVDVTVNGVESYFPVISISGNIFEDNGSGSDNRGALGDATVATVTDNTGALISIPNDGSNIKIVGLYGTLTINNLGEYTYEANGDQNAIDKSDIFNYTLISLDGLLTDSATITINLSGNIVPDANQNILYAVDNDVNTILNAAPKTTTNELGSETAFTLVGVDLGYVLDLSLLDTDDMISLTVDENTVRDLTITANAGGIAVGASFDLYIYKYDQVSATYKQFDVQENWFTVVLLGGNSAPLSLSLPEGEYRLILAPDEGITIATGYTLNITSDLTYDYNDPDVSNVKLITGNIITDDNGLGVDIAPSGTIVTTVKGVAIALSGDTVIQGKYGILTITSQGEYSYDAIAIPEYGVTDSFSYTIYDSVSGLYSFADLNLRFDVVNAVNDFYDSALNVTNPAATLNYNDSAGLNTLRDVENKVYEFTIQDNSFNITSIQLMANNIGQSNVTISYRLISVNSESEEVIPQRTQTSGEPLLSDTINLSAGTYQLIYSIDVPNGFLQAGATWDLTVNSKTTSGNLLVNDIMSFPDYSSITINNQTVYTANDLDNVTGPDSITIAGNYGSLLLNSDGTYVYTQSGSAFGYEEFEYSLNSPSGSSDTAILTINAGKNFTGSVGLMASTAGGDVFNSSVGNMDTVIYNVIDQTDNAGGNGTDTWTNFNVGSTSPNSEADMIDISDLLVDYAGDGSATSLADYLSVTSDGTDTTISIDRDGTGGQYQSTDILVLRGVETTLTDLVNNNQFII
ncbi:beta strand repeat-containing protein [Acinetobacter lwoffii]|uniref:beta strand repeat-containing protein n=1 Tax=Acinetobacter lwoffii TaxID=28090 RepID=UPI00209BA035|nr:type I secretion C-terminal target domain-containing protein [Acinetobacter lwoffii]